ncbi:TetR/AcrR family transcriptional regulator [uncultured Gordonia sp.]|uniref:TetR/AcrR family transcriptional regulator n=1 Tax=uncultured Gordonia sp. TaxID=198437 RepID=UPI002585CEC2|nr:TetR/AcrR family transcriptional regulator [uncultured Gordonia sp.]
MSTNHSPDAYYETGLAILSDLGFGGLKLAEVCRRSGVTSGSFYHYFPKWSAYTTGLIEYWREDRTVRLIAGLDSEPDPWARLRHIIEIGVSLPHGAEAAIRTWSHLDTAVRGVQADVDRQRFDAVASAVAEITGDRDAGDLFAHWAVYLLVGFEQSNLGSDTAALEQAMNRLAGEIESLIPTAE